MSQSLFPPLPLAEWRSTRDTLHSYSRLLSKVRQAMTPPQKHWWHISLHTTPSGLTTTPIPAGPFTFGIDLDLTVHLASIRTSQGEQLDLVLEGQPPAVFYRDTMETLAGLDIHPQVDASLFADERECDYEDEHVENFWQALSQLDILLKEFRGTFRGESSPVQFWSHHFDLSLVWFSGRLVPGQDPNNASYADEQMAFGFSTGDEGIPDPYLYITAYPWPAALQETGLPAGARWQSEGWKGAVLMYDQLVQSDDPRGMLFDYWHALHTAGKQIMQGDWPDEAP